MKSLGAKAKKETPSKDHSQVSSKLRKVIAETRYEAPKVISFPSETKAKTSLPQITMMGNFL